MTYILQKCDEIPIKKGEILLKDGKICQHVWFIKKGMLQARQLSPADDDKPVKWYTHWFMKEGDIATSVNSFFEACPSDEEIVATEDSILFQMSKEDLFAGFERYPGLAILTLRIVIRYYCNSRFNEKYLRMKEPKFIFQRMMTECPDILQRALQGDLATFLGVSEPVFREIKSSKGKHKAK